MDRYLAGESVTEDALLEDLHRAMARGTFFPVVPACSTSGVGCEELLDLIVRGFPAPSEHPSPATYTPAGRADRSGRRATPHGPLVAEVVKTTSDPYVGRISLVRVFSGTLDPDRPVHVSGHLTSFFGAGVRPRRPRRRRAGRLALLPVRRSSSAGQAGGLRRHRVGRPADPGRDRRHPLLGRRPAGAAAVVAADPAAAGGDRGRHQVRRGQALHRARPAGRRGPVAARRDGTASSWCSGRWARRTRRRAGAALRPLRGVGEPGRRPGADARDARARRARRSAGT